jgi:plasmid stabilization system protein ParE
MSRPVILRPEAERDAERARIWYEDRSPGLGDEFWKELSSAIDLIESSPELFARVWRNNRAYLLHRFPYILYYQVLPDRIEVLAVLHALQDQSQWQGRN